MPRPRLGRPARRWRLLGVILLTSTLVVAGAVLTNVGGAGDRFDGVLRRLDRLLAGPVPDRSSRPTVAVTEEPLHPSPSVTATASPSSATVGSAPTTSRTSTPTTVPVKRPVDVEVVGDPDRVFAHQADKDWCAVAGVAMVLEHHRKVDATDSFQRELAGRVREWESWDDSHDGNWGPAAMALALEAYGVPGYEIRAYGSRGAALRDVARQISRTDAPAILLTWRGAHTWVMTGYRANADPEIHRDAEVEGAYILDPWYPWVSSIWGASNPPGFFTRLPELTDNYLPWKRPEGAYPDRDGKFIALVPTVER